MTIVRNFIALVLLFASVACALAGASAMWVHHVATTEEPTRDVIAPLVSNPAVQSALAGELEGIAKQHIPTTVDRLGLRSHLETLISTSVREALAADGVEQAWHQSIDRSRAELVSTLSDYRRDPSVTPTLWVDLTPFVELGKARLEAAADGRLEPVISQISWGEDARIALGRPDARTTMLASEGLWLAEHWVWAYVAAAVLAIAGLAVGTRRGRWGAWILAALLGLGALLTGRYVLSQMDFVAGDGMASVVTSQLSQGLINSYLSFSEAWQWWLLGAILAGVGAWLILTFSAKGRAQVVA